MKKRLLCTTILLSLVLMSGCGKNASDQAMAADVPVSAVAGDLAPDEGPTEAEATVPVATDSEAADASVLTDVSEYPSRSKVTYDTLFSAIDKDELREFVLGYLKDNDTSFSRYDVEDYEISYMGCLFQSYGVPGTENFTNGLAYFFREKYTLHGEGKSMIRAIYADKLTLKEEGKFEDFQFDFNPEEPSFTQYPYDDDEFAAVIVDPEKMIGNYQRFSHDSISAGADMISYFYDSNDEFYQAYADGSLVRNVKYDSASDSYNAFFDNIIAYFDTAMTKAIDTYYPELAGKNTGTFSQN